MIYMYARHVVCRLQ